MTEAQLAELECHLAAGTDVATAMAAVDQPPAPTPGRNRVAGQLGLLVGLVLGLMYLWLCR
jgi:hypothetical protein